MKNNAELLKEIELYSASFDHWHGPVHPFKKAYVARQNWQTISVKAVDEILENWKVKRKERISLKFRF